MKKKFNFTIIDNNSIDNPVVHKGDGYATELEAESIGDAWKNIRWTAPQYSVNVFKIEE